MQNKTIFKTAGAAVVVSALAILSRPTELSLDPLAPVEPVELAPTSPDDAMFSIASPQAPRLYEIQLPAGDVGSVNVDWFNNGAAKLDPKTWLDDGDNSDPEPDDYDGVTFVGQGIDVTHLRGTSWDGITVAVLRHNGIVQLENLTLHSGYEKGMHFGEGNYDGEYRGGVLIPGTQRIRHPKFKFQLVNVKGVVDAPFEYFKRNQKFRVANGGHGYRVGETLTAVGGDGTAAVFRVKAANPIGVVETPDLTDGEIRSLEIASAGNYTRPPPFGGTPTTSNGSGTSCLIDIGIRPKWLIFSYNADGYITGCDLNSREAVEHTVYMHGFARAGVLVERTNFSGSGAESFKVRSDITETAWAGPGTTIVMRDCRFRDCYQPWSWRGGAFVVIQGGASHALFERCFFWGGYAIGDLPSYLRSKAIMVSSEGSSYAHGTGVIGTGFGNGHIVVNECAMVAGPGTAPSWHNTIVRCGQNSGTQQSARSFTLQRSGLWGDGMIVSIGDMPLDKVKVLDCNTPFITEWCGRNLAMDTSKEITYGNQPLSRVRSITPR